MQDSWAWVLWWFIFYLSGRRSCFGESLARAEIFLILTSLMQRFVVLPPEGQEKVDVKPMLPVSINLIPQPYFVRIIERHWTAQGKEPRMKNISYYAPICKLNETRICLLSLLAFQPLTLWINFQGCFYTAQYKWIELGGFTAIWKCVTKICIATQ